MRIHEDEISPQLINTILFKEDKYFYYHPGVNPFAIVKSLFGNILHRKIQSGASTITMQVARALQPRKRNYVNKLIEIFRAEQLELKYSKKNSGTLPQPGSYGVKYSGRKGRRPFYFRKNPDHLSLADNHLVHHSEPAEFLGNRKIESEDCGSQEYMVEKI
jgi:penicillin-binding protein 1C